MIALVVQPGVEFGHTEVVHLRAGAGAGALAQSLDDLPRLVFEAHSTDYQTAAALTALVGDGFAILKVGPWLTFALREALYGLDAIAEVLDGQPPQGAMMTAMEEVMLAAPANWASYYSGSDKELWLQRHFSYSDRIRYYWPAPKASEAAARVLARLEGKANSGAGHEPVPAGRADRQQSAGRSRGSGRGGAGRAAAGMRGRARRSRRDRADQAIASVSPLSGMRIVGLPRRLAAASAIAFGSMVLKANMPK